MGGEMWDIIYYIIIFRLITHESLRHRQASAQNIVIDFLGKTLEIDIHGVDPGRELHSGILLVKKDIIQSQTVFTAILMVLFWFMI